MQRLTIRPNPSCPMHERVLRVMLLVVVKDGTQNWYSLHEQLIRPLLHPGLEVTWCNNPGPLSEISTESDVREMEPYVVDGAQQAQEDGYDAVAVACLLHPGVLEAQQRVCIPVVGSAEAGMWLAANLGDRVAVVIGSGDETLIREAIAKTPNASHLLAIRTAGEHPLAFAGHGASESAVANLRKEMECAVEEAGVNTIIGYGGLPELEQLRRVLRIPIISPIQAAVLYAEHRARTEVLQQLAT